MSKNKFEQKIFEFDFEGESYTIQGMTMREVEILDEAKGENTLKTQKEVLVSLGMNEDVYYKLSPNNIASIVEGLIDAKK